MGEDLNAASSSAPSFIHKVTTRSFFWLMTSADEPIEGDLRFNMVAVPASISETSVELELTDEKATRNRTALTFEQEIALEALRLALID